MEEDVAVQTPPNSLEQLAAEASLENLSLDDQMARLNISLEDEPEMLKVVLRPVLGCKIGMTVMRFAEGFIVTSIHDKGIVASWNAAHPGQSLEERDLIVQINGSGEYLQMLHHFRCAPVLLMLIHRQEPLKSRQLPQGAQFEPRSGKESKDNFVLESNLALRSITECAGTHPDEVWKAAALCVVEHFVQQDPFFLSLYGYKALTSKMWSPLNEGLKPRLSLKVSQHIEQAGHTWYIVECELLALSGEQEMALRWESPRRLSQLRGELHDRIKFTMDSAEYRSLFEDAPFAHSGGPSGTTTRLFVWLSRLAALVNKQEVTPAVAALTLSFFHAPLSSAVQTLLPRNSDAGRPHPATCQCCRG